MRSAPLVVSKYVANREKDCVFYCNALQHGIVAPAILIERVHTLDPDAQRIASITHAIERDARQVHEPARVRPERAAPSRSRRRPRQSPHFSGDNAAPGNNAPAGFDPRIFTYGHRNVQGIAFRPGTGQPFTAEHGPNHSDEVTPLVAGGNAGWDPQNRPGLNCPDNYCGYAGNVSTMPMTDTTRFPNAMRPSWTNDNASQGMGPATFLDGAQWKAWNGRLAVGIMGQPGRDTRVEFGRHGRRQYERGAARDPLSLARTRPRRRALHRHRRRRDLAGRSELSGREHLLRRLDAACRRS